ncbi:MAG: hypothetical protein DRQ65_06040 [Gammaproteobacteria bacterium]|nr:MAG: hypothetical protein DRQ65_06040 [Gammaproteobacteria bacterium]
MLKSTKEFAITTVALGALCLVAHAQAAVEPVELSGENITDSVHGVQMLSTGNSVSIGIPATYTAQFEFTLPSSEAGVNGQFPYPDLTVAWRVKGPGAAVASVLEMYSDATPEGYLPKQWYGESSPHSRVSVFKFDSLAGTGTAGVDIPLGRTGEHSLYPPLGLPSSEIELMFGPTTSMTVDHKTSTVSGALFSASASMSTAALDVVVDIARPICGLGETVVGTVIATSFAVDEREFFLKPTVGGVVRGLPDSVIIPAGELFAGFAFQVMVEADLQIMVRESTSSGVAGYSTMVNASFGITPVRSMAAGTSTESLPALMPYGYDETANYHTGLTSEDFAFDDMHQEANSWEFWFGCLPVWECRPAVPHMTPDGFWKKCGLCAVTTNPPTQHACPPGDGLVLHTVASCNKRCRAEGEPFQNCYWFDQEMDLPVYGADGQHSTRESCGFSFGASVSYIVGASVSTTKFRHCCWFESTGTTEPHTVRQCRQNFP